MRQADRLLHLVFDPVTEAWLQELNPSACSLRSSYAVGRPRRDTYAELVERILAPVRQGLRVCWATYGHPGLCAESGHAAVRQARAEGHRAVMLPGVSCDDTLFADLGLDPARDGCQHYDATNFLLCRRLFDPRASLILWQVGLLGQQDYRQAFSAAGLPLLVEMLAPVYGPRHVVTLYEAALYAVCDPVVQQVALEDLPGAELRWSMTLYVPPLAPATPDAALAQRLAALLAG